MNSEKLKSEHILKDVNKEVINLLKKSNLLRTLIKNFLINKLIKDITLTRTEVNDEISNFYDKNFINDSNNLNKYLEFYGITEEDLRYQILL